MRLHLRSLLVITLVTVLAAACGSTKPAMPNPVKGPVLDHPGTNMVRYRDMAIEIVIESGFASNNLAEEWLVLNVALSGMTGASTKVDRRLISVRTPDGRTVPLPSYRDFNASWDRDLQSVSRRADLASQPLEFTRGGRRNCAISFMPLPGSGAAANTAINVTNNQVCTGFLYFPIRGGVQPGSWRFIIEFEETEARVPFELGAQ